MEEQFLYRQIAIAFRQQIMQGELRPGQRLPPMRALMKDWNCTLSTAQRAYQELARQGLVISRPGQGTHVNERLAAKSDTPLRRASLIHRAETFLLEVLTAGYTPSDVEDAVRVALDHWREVAQEPDPAAPGILRFEGSHDLAVAWIAGHLPAIVPGWTLNLTYSGSLAGLISLAGGHADLAGSHLWDAETRTYNAPFVQRILPGRRVALVTLAHRRLGLVLPPGNPAHILKLADLTKPGLRFANRQPGSGTRVWLEIQLQRLGIEPAMINGYHNVYLTHSEVARVIAEGAADVGLAFEGAAASFGLDFIPLTNERYDLVIPAETMTQPAIQLLINWLSSQAGRQALSALPGYETSETGSLAWIG